MKDLFEAPSAILVLFDRKDVIKTSDEDIDLPPVFE